MLDCLVIGGGPAGLLAAVYLGRYRRSVQVIDAGESRAAKIPESHNYPGFFGIAGPELLCRLKAQARQYGAELVSGRVTSLRKEDETFVATCSGSDVSARFMLLATGRRIRTRVDKEIAGVDRVTRAKLEGLRIAAHHP
jgi:thioredoxin reductase (NADPH)